MRVTLTALEPPAELVALPLRPRSSTVPPPAVSTLKSFCTPPSSMSSRGLGAVGASGVTWAVRWALRDCNGAEGGPWGGQLSPLQPLHEAARSWPLLGLQTSHHSAQGFTPSLQKWQSVQARFAQWGSS